MPLLDNPFTCSNGHNFNANAKIRARCPECGEKASRNFSTEPPKTDGDKTEHKGKAPIATPVLLRRGKVVPTPKKPVAKKPGTKPVAAGKSTAAARTANGLVKIRRIPTKGVTPQVKRPPAKTAVARHIKGAAPDRRNKSFLDSVVERFGPR